jgi:signal transduction histidine kinase
MQQLPEPGDQEFFQQRAIAALTSLSALALQTSTLRFSPPAAADRLAALFLNQLVSLCEAQQGALFLLHSSPIQEAILPTSPYRSLIARTRMSTQEAQTLLISAVPLPVRAQAWPAHFPSVMRWSRLLAASFSHMVYIDALASAAASQFSAILLFAWSTAEQETRDEPQRQASQLLPLLADLVDTILLHIFTALQEEHQPQEMFPTELLATVGHEFRGPLTTIQGYSATLLRHDQRLELAERQDFLHAITEASTHLGTLVDRFLELAQLEAHAHVFFPAPVNLLTLTQESLAMVPKKGTHRLLLVPSRTQKEVLVVDRNSETLPDEWTLLGDRRLLRTMLDMLLENAIAYSAPESLVEVSVEPMTAVTVSAALHAPSQPGAHLALILPRHFQAQESLLVLRVRDHGIGIEPDHLALIFRRFYRVDTRLTRSVNGLGLGLALCKAIIALHKGMLWVESVVGEGSTFSLVLPRRIALAIGGEAEQQRITERLEYHI